MGARSLVIIEWLDSRRPVPEWQWLADFNPQEMCRCTSVGWLIHDGEDAKSLAPNVASLDSDDDAQASGVITIPTVSIVRMLSLTNDSTLALQAELSKREGVTTVVVGPEEKAALVMPDGTQRAIRGPATVSITVD